MSKRYVIVNDLQTINSGGGSGTFTFSIPNGKDVKLVEGTFATNSNVNTDLRASELSFVWKDSGERANIIADGTPTIHELFGNGQFPRLFNIQGVDINLSALNNIQMTITNQGSSNWVLSVSFYIVIET